MKERLLAELDARIARHADGDSSGVLDERALGLVTELAAAGRPDAGSLVRVAALHLCRYQALPREHGRGDLRLARTLYTNLHAVDPRLVPPWVRELFGLASPHERGIALMHEYEQAGRLDDLERAISLFRQEALEQADRADGLGRLATALLCRFERTGSAGDLDEAVAAGRAALAATPVDHPTRGGRSAWVGAALRLRSARTGTRAPSGPRP
jgi:hypothetical protein